MNFRAAHTLPALAAAMLTLSGCNQELEDRLDRIEAEMREIRSDTRDEVGRISDRVDAAEAKLDTDADESDLRKKVGDLELALRSLQRSLQTEGRMAYLRPHLKGHVPLQTDHGTFLIRIEGMDLNLESGGYDVHLNIGNPVGLAVQQFTLKGDFGGNLPTLEEGEEYSLFNEKLEKWQKTLKPFESKVSTVLKPYAWTPVDVSLPADTRDQLELIRFTMSVENAHLESPGTGKGGKESFAHLEVGSRAAQVISTEYGAFLIMVKEAVDDSGGVRLNLEIGNPYGFTISQCRLLGDFGKMVPERGEDESQNEFASRLRTWTDSLQPFEAVVTSKLPSFRWNRASIVVPGSLEDVEFLRCRLRVEGVSLPSASERR